MNRDLLSATLCGADELTVTLEGMEHDRRTVDEACAEEVRRQAADLGRPDLVARARLVAADARCRAGDLTGAAPALYDVRRWAAEQDDRYVLARAHFLLSIVHTYLGDIAEARRHALLSVDCLPGDTAPIVRGNHLIVLALAVDMVSRDDGYRYHAEALDIAAATGDDEMARSVLNNLAYAAYQAGDAEAADGYVRRMYRVVARGVAELRPADLDTVARVAMLRGDHAEAERLLLPLTDPRATGLDAEANMLAEVLLTIAEAQRLQGACERARRTLDRCFAVCAERSLAEVRARARRELALLFAAEGRWREAFEEHVRYDAEAAELRSAEREAQARLTQQVFESREGRRDVTRFRELALRDPLTGLYNRRFVDNQLPSLLRQAAATGRPLSLALLDVDFFKRVNDTLSHEVGDVVLRRIGRLLTAEAEDVATAARLGGEEFVLVMPALDADAAVALAERLRLVMQDEHWQPITGDLPVTISAGVATARPDDSPGALLARADRHLYTAKRTGRNRVVSDITGDRP